MLDALDRALIARISDDIGDSRHPFRALAADLGLTEDDVLTRLQAYREAGILRRFGAILRHQRAGLTANGMSVWLVPAADVARVGALLSACPEVTHCYERPPMPDWPYNVYAMIHADSEAAVAAIAARLAEETGLADYRLLFSLREFKKTSMRYFAE